MGGRELEGKVALVTGASQGIGLAIARRLGAAGAAVAANSRSPQRAEETARQLSDDAIAAVPAPGDVSDPDDAERIVAATLEQLGRIDVLVNNAGIDADASSQELPLADWERVLATNVDGAFFCARFAGADMLARGSGVIVGIGSLWGNLGMPERAAYGVSKHALRGLTMALAREWAPHGIRVATVDPGYIETELIEVVRGGTADDLRRRTPIGRLGRPEDVADAVAFLASDRAAGMTGLALRVDGGWMAYGGW